MATPDLRISPEAADYVRRVIDGWDGEARDIALALSAFGAAMLMIVDGRDDHIQLYEAAAKEILQIKTPMGTA